MLRGPPTGRPAGRRIRLVAALVVSAGAVAAALSMWATTSGRSGPLVPSPPLPGATAPGAPAAAAALAAGVRPALVDIVTASPGDTGRASATGMVISRSGLVATSAHVVAQAGTIRVTDPVAGRTFTAHVMVADTQADVALLQVESPSGLTPIMASYLPLTPGAGVVAVGNMAGGTGPTTYVAGSVTGLNRAVSVANPMTGEVQILSGLIEVNAPLVSGDSGGALVDTSGHVVAMIAAGNGGFVRDQTLTRGYAVPIGQVLGLARPFAPAGA